MKKALLVALMVVANSAVTVQACGSCDAQPAVAAESVVPQEPVVLLKKQPQQLPVAEEATETLESEVEKAADIKE